MADGRCRTTGERGVQTESRNEKKEALVIGRSTVEVDGDDTESVL